MSPTQTVLGIETLCKDCFYANVLKLNYLALSNRTKVALHKIAKQPILQLIGYEFIQNS